LVSEGRGPITFALIDAVGSRVPDAFEAAHYYVPRTVKQANKRPANLLAVPVSFLADDTTAAGHGLGPRLVQWTS